MAQISFKGNSIQTAGSLPETGSTAPDFLLVTGDLAEKSLADFSGKKVLNIFPSIDTGICAMSVRKFNEKASSMEGVTVINVSADLPFAQSRFCGAEGLDGAICGSTFRGSFLADYGVTMLGGPLKGLASRAVVVLDENNKIIYTEQVPEIVQEPDYDAALAALSK